MKKVMTLVILLATLFVAVAPVLAASGTDLVRLEIRNDTDGPLWISISGNGSFYYLPVSAGKSHTFTVERGMYADMRAGACDIQVEGTLDLSSNVRLRFLPCWGSLSNFGEPTREVVNLLSPPPNSHWRFQFKYYLTRGYTRISVNQGGACGKRCVGNMSHTPFLTN